MSLMKGDVLQGWWSLPEGFEEKPLDKMDKMVGCFVAIHALGILYFKWKTNRLVFLLQPCNVWIILMTYMSFSRSLLAAQFFNFYLHTQWGSWLGLLAPDLRDYKTKIEIVLFFSMHLVLVLFPVYHIVRGNLAILPGDAYGVYCIFIAVHWLFFLPFSLWLGVQVQYMTYPPKQLVFAGTNYRFVVTPTLFFFSWFMREQIVATGLAMIGHNP